MDKTAEYGTDALRLALTIGITPGNDGALGDNKIAGYRNFCNKLWNVARFTLDKAGDYSPTPPKPVSLADEWILTAFSRENAAITKAIEEYRFSEAGERVYSLLWNDFADWYLEASKSELNVSVLVSCLEAMLKLAHPFAPFVTEAIWQNMPWKKQNLIVSTWPAPGKKYEANADKFSKIMALVSQIRTISANLELAKPSLVYVADDLLESEAKLVERLANVNVAKVGEGRGLRVPTGDFECWLDVDAATVQSYRTILEHKRDGVGEYLKRLQAQLANKSYVQSAPPELVEQTKDRTAESKLLLSQLDEQIKAIKT